MKATASICNEYDIGKIKKILEKHFKLIGIRFRKNSVFLIKPNLLGAYSKEMAITTHPAVIEAVCRTIKPYAKSIIIADSSGESTERALEVCGMNSLSKYAKIINLDKEESSIKKINGYDVPIPNIIKECDYIINAAKLKTHVLTRATLCTKNLYGCIPGKFKGEFHKKCPDPEKFAKFLIALKEKINPQVNIIDGITGIEGNGPGLTGKIKKANVIITSDSALGADILGARIMGFNPKTIPTIMLDKKRKKELHILEKEEIDKIPALKFRQPTRIVNRISFLYNRMPSSIIAFNDNCMHCHKCEKKCPMHAIKITKDSSLCSHKKCILCMCCIEICPHKAVYLRQPKITSFVNYIKRKAMRE